jgi:hypothetical protein
MVISDGIFLITGPTLSVSGGLFYQSWVRFSQERIHQRINPILHTAWLDNHALTLKSNSAKYYFHEKSSFLHTFLKYCCESRKI